MSLNPEDTRPASQQVADVIRAEIASGSLVPGDQVPSVRELATRFEIAQLTAQAAVSILRKDGLVYSSPGRGTFVRAGADEMAATSDDGLARQIAGLQSRLDEMSASSSSGDLADVKSELAELRRAVATLQSQLIDLYGRTGQPYPHGSVSVTAKPDSSSRRVG